VQEGVFTNVRRMTWLSLTNNVISSIEPHVFDESANLTLLANIDLSHNELTELEPWPLIRAQHRPMNVFLQNNHIANFTNTLRWSFNCSSPWVFETQLDASANDIKHITDAIRGWNIDGKRPLCYVRSVYLKWSANGQWGSVGHRRSNEWV